MKIFPLIIALPMLAAGQSVLVRIGAYNVACGQWGTPEAIGKMLKQYDLDIVGFNEKPRAQPGKTVPVWTQAAGKEMGMPYFQEGTISSANHKAPAWQDALHLYEGKYKSIASRTPLTNFQDFVLQGSGWSPASVVRAETVVKGVTLAVYSLHIPGANQVAGSMHEYLLKTVLAKEKLKNFVVVGDFNNSPNEATMTLLETGGKMRNSWRDIATVDLARDATFLGSGCPCPGRIIDHVMYSLASGAKAMKGGIIELDPALSDHKPVWVELSLPSDPTSLILSGDRMADRVSPRPAAPWGNGRGGFLLATQSGIFTLLGRR